MTIFTKTLISLTIALTLCFSALSQKDKSDKIPKETRRSVELLSDYLTRDCTSDRSKVDSIYAWIINNIDYEYEALESAKPPTFQGSERTLKAGKAICNGYVRLMVDMLESIEIKSEYIEGYTRTFEPDYEYVLYEAQHAWISIKIDGKWHLADPTWDAGYIGRIPKKEKSYPKRWDKERTFKNEVKSTKWEEKIKDKKESFDLKLSKRDPYTDKIGFVRDTSLVNYLMHADTFLLTHMPTLPEWQLRNKPLSIEQFCQPKDSVRLALNDPKGEEQEFQLLVEAFSNMSFLQKWLYTADVGFAFNPNNHGVKAINNYNSMAVFLDSDLKKELKRYPSFQTDPLWHELLPKADTAIVHGKLALKTTKLARKEKNNFYKASFKEESTAQKTIIKQNEKLNKAMVKLDESIDKSDDKINSSREKTAGKIAKYESYDRFFKKSPGVRNDSGKEIEGMMNSFDSLNACVDSIVLKLNFHRENSALNGLYQNVQNAKYETRYANAYVSVFNIDVSDEIALHDSLAIECLQNGQLIIRDSIMNEIESKYLISSIRSLDQFATTAKKQLQLLNEEGKIKNPEAYEKYMFAKVYERYSEYRQLQLNSLSYNAYLKKNLKVIQKALSGLDNTAKTLEKSRDDRDEQLFDELEESYDRGENLYKQILDKSNVWKKDLKKRLKQ